MGYPPHALVQFGGTLTPNTGQGEIWTCGVRVTKAVVGGGGGFLDDPQGYATSLVTPLKNWFGAAANGLANDSKLTFVKVNNIDPVGRYVDATTHQAAIAPTVGGGIPNAPQFCCVALTLETGATRGHAHRGRIYLPNYTYTSVGSQINATAQTAILAMGKALMTLLQSPAGGATAAATPVVVSKLGAGTVRQISGVSVDNLYDYISRRKDRLTATRMSGAAY